MKESEYKFDTLQLHAGQEPDPATGSRAVPIYQTTSYSFRSAQHAEDLFSLKEAGNIYTRIMNPTTDVLERRLAALEGGIGGLAFSSGSAAITCAIQNLAEAGDHIVAASTLYGGTYNLLAYTMPRFGIRTTLVDPSDPARFVAAMEEKTKAVLVEAIGNPGINLCDIRAIATVAHRHGVPLIVDNTFATPYLFRPFEHGADLVAHSLTKFIGGHGTSIGGAIVDGGTFDWSADPDRYPQYNTPDPSYHGLVFARDVGEAAYITRARVLMLRDTGGCISPFNAFLILQGMETLSLRMRQHVANAQKLAEFLEGHPNVSSVSYPGLASSPYHALARQYFPRGAGAILAFECRGGREAGRRLIDRLTLFSNLANVGDAKSLVIHPASTTHAQLSERSQAEAGVTPGQIRVSVGIEDISDLIRDMRQALEA